MSTASIPKEQWAQVVEKKGGRTSIQSPITYNFNKPSSIGLQEDSRRKAWS